jgi:hypothetical protein
VEPVEQGGATGLKGRVAGARHRGTPAREVAEQPSMKALSTEQWSQGGRRHRAEQGGREAGGATVPSRAGRPDHRAKKGGREAGGATVLS